MLTAFSNLSLRVRKTEPKRLRLVITCIFMNLHRNLLIINITPRRLMSSMFFILCPVLVTAICSSLLRMMSMLMMAGLMLSGIHLYTPAVSSPTYDIIIIIILFSVFCIVFIIYILYSVFAHLQYTWNCTFFLLLFYKRLCLCVR